MLYRVKNNVKLAYLITGVCKKDGVVIEIKVLVFLEGRIER